MSRTVWNRARQSLASWTRAWMEGDFQERQVAQVVQILVLVVFLHTPVDNGVGDGLHHVPVEVRSPQPLGGVHGGADHHHVGEVAQVVFAHLLHWAVGVEENFLISGDVGISQQGAGRLALIPGPGRVESVVLKLDGLCDGQKGPLGLGALFRSHIQQRDQKLQQVPGEEPDVPGHLQPAQGRSLLKAAGPWPPAAPGRPTLR